MRRPAAMRRSGGLALAAVLIGGILMAASLGAQSNQVQTVSYGAIVSAKAVTIQDKPSGSKTMGGAAVGAVAGAAIAGHGHHFGGAIIGGLAGAAIGSAADKADSVKPGTELIIKLDNGQEIAIQIPGTLNFLPGDRVRMISGSSGTKVERVETPGA
jgi:outer membrane lipoprotein SlyB